MMQVETQQGRPMSVRRFLVSLNEREKPINDTQKAIQPNVLAKQKGRHLAKRLLSPYI
jgi:hypothetical protein